MPSVVSVKNTGKGISPLMKGDSLSKRTLGAKKWGFLAVYRCRFLICYLNSHPLLNYQKINSFAIILRSSCEMTYIDWTTAYELQLGQNQSQSQSQSINQSINQSKINPSSKSICQNLRNLSCCSVRLLDTSAIWV